MRIEALPFRRDTLDQAVESLTRAIAGRSGGWLLTPNTSIARGLTSQPELAWITERATHIYADGAPIVWLSRTWKDPLPQRVTGADLLPRVLPKLAAGTVIGFIGGPPGVAERAAGIARRHDLVVAVASCPPQDFDRTSAGLRNYARGLVMEMGAPPSVIVMGLPFPRQEKLAREIAEIATHPIYFLNTGAAMNFLTGHHARAPYFMRIVGLEWLWRLGTEPGRLWRRYLAEDLPFLLREVVMTFALDRKTKCRNRRT